MQAAATLGHEYASLPPRRPRLLRSLDRLGAAMDARHTAQLTDLGEMRVWLAARVFTDSAEPTDNALWRTLAQWIDRERDPHVRRQWCAMLITLAGRVGVELFHTGDGALLKRNLVSLREMFRRREDWARSADDWRPARVQGSEDALIFLARHLFVRWNMPAFMDQVWSHPGRRARMNRDLYAHIAAGRPLRDAPLPYQLTKRQAHLLMQAPDDASIESALAWADVAALGGSPALARDLSMTELGRGLLISPHRRAYWLSIVRYFVEHAAFGQRHGGAVVDCLRARIDGGAQNGLRLHGRNPDAVLAEVQEWHQALANRSLDRESARRVFPDPGFNDGEWIGEAELFDTVRPGWKIHRVRNALELREEGRAMANCVFSYAGQCSAGQCSIWSLERGNAEGDYRRFATVRLAGHVIVEAKERANRRLGIGARVILDRWRQQENLRSRFI